MRHIRVNAKDFFEYVEMTKQYPETEQATALEISIYEYEDDNGKINKYLTIDIESEGDGLISNDESIEECPR